MVSGTAAVNLGSAINYSVLAETGISNTGTTNISGNIGVSPGAATTITGFALNLDPSGQFSTSTSVMGKVYAADYTSPTPATLAAAVTDMGNAYADASSRSPDYSYNGTQGEIGGLTLLPGVHKFSTAVTISQDVTLSGSDTDVWIFQTPAALDISAGQHIFLSGGAVPRNIFWTVGGATTLGSGSVFEGNILDAAAITLNTGATLEGRALAGSAVTLIGNTITVPAEPPSIQITVANVPVSALSLNVAAPTVNTDSVFSINSSTNWQVAASDQNGHGGYMYNFSVSDGYQPGHLSLPFQVKDSTGTYVDLSTPPVLRTGTTEESSTAYPLDISQAVKYADPVLPGTNVYRITVTLTATNIA